MPQFDQDVFISYWHKNNEVPSGKGNGWVDVFQNRLRVSLNDRLGREVSVWRDPRLPGHVSLPSYLQNEIKRSVALVCIVSPGYLNSDWCMGELREFRRLAPESGGLLIAGQYRILKVVKIPDPLARSSDFEDSKGYEFYALDPTTKKDVEFDWLPEPYGDDKFRTKLDDLVRDIEGLLRVARPELQTRAARRDVFGTASTAPKKSAVYLAETTSELKMQREEIARELDARGYEIRPKVDLPHISPDCENKIRSYLQDCKMSVHMMGSTYGFVPEGAGGKSILRLQHELALERASQAPFTRIIWSPKNLEVREKEQINLLEELKASLDARHKDAFLETESLGPLKEFVLQRLIEPPPLPQPVVGGVKKVYVIFDRRDADSIGPVTQYLNACGYEVEVPVLETSHNNPKAIAIHNQHLIECNGALIYYGTAGQIWFQSQKSDLEKRPGLVATVGGSSVPPSWKDAIYVTNPDSPHKRLFTSVKAFVFKHFGPFQPDLLKPFVEALRSSS